MNLDFIVELLEEHGDFSISGNCVDCNKDVKVEIKALSENQIEITGGAIFRPPKNYNYQEEFVCKCEECFKLDKQIHQKNEVYTRVVGYLRPTSQMNPGRLAEINQRMMFHIPEM